MLPNDPYMLLSFINTKLRDEYSSLDELSSSLGADKEQILNKLAGAGFVYDSDQNRFNTQS